MFLRSPAPRLQTTPIFRPPTQSVFPMRTLRLARISCEEIYPGILIGMIPVSPAQYPRNRIARGDMPKATLMALPVR